MGFGPFSTGDNKAEDSRIAAADQARVVKGKGKIVGGADLTKANVNTGLSVGKGFKGNITLGDGGAAVADVSRTFAQTLSQISSQSNQALQDALAQQASNAQSTSDNALGKVTDLSQSEQTGGSSFLLTKTVWILLGVMALLGATGYFLFKRR
jgi:hypothetical protein